MDRTSSPMFLSPTEKTMPGRVKDQLLQSTSRCTTNAGCHDVKQFFVPIQYWLVLTWHIASHQAQVSQWPVMFWKKPLPVRWLSSKVSVSCHFMSMSFCRTLRPDSPQKKSSRFLLTISQGSVNRTHFFLGIKPYESRGHFGDFPCNTALFGARCHRMIPEKSWKIDDSGTCPIFVKLSR